MVESKESRLFVGVQIPERLKGRIAQLQEELVGKGIKLVEPENLHITLCFIGEVQKAKEESIKKEIKKLKFKKLSLTLEGTGAFPDLSRPQVVFLKVISDERFKTISKELYEHLKITPDYKKFKSHLTIARFRKGEKGEVRKFVIKNKNVKIGDFSVDKVYLYSSRLTSLGLVYSKIGEVSAIDSL